MSQLAVSSEKLAVEVAAEGGRYIRWFGLNFVGVDDLGDPSKDMRSII